MYSFLSISENRIYTSEIVINKSRFLGFAKYVDNTEDAENFINQLKIKYKDARHVCFAYKLLSSARASDDGEPSGTAGKPILGVIEKKGLVNIVVVVVRYFGGIKLGAGGLLRAYSNTANEVINNASVCEWYESNICEINMPYKDYQNFINKIKGRYIKILESNFDNGAFIKFVSRIDEDVFNAKIIGKTMSCF